MSTLWCCHPAFSLSTTASPTLQSALKDGFGEAVVACDMPEPCKTPINKADIFGLVTCVLIHDRVDLDRAEVTLGGLQDIKIQLSTNLPLYLRAGDSTMTPLCRSTCPSCRASPPTSTSLPRPLTPEPLRWSRA